MIENAYQIYARRAAGVEHVITFTQLDVARAGMAAAQSAYLMNEVRLFMA